MKFAIGLSMLIIFFGGIFCFIVWAYSLKVAVILYIAVLVLVIFMIVAISLMTGQKIL